MTDTFLRKIVYLRWQPYIADYGRYLFNNYFFRYHAGFDKIYAAWQPYLLSVIETFLINHLTGYRVYRHIYRLSAVNHYAAGYI